MKCKTSYCRNDAAKHSKFCHTCNKRKYRAKNKLRASFQAHKDNAKRRGIEFSISFDYYVDFVTKHDYIAKKGIYKTSLHIDRVKEHLGYIEGNLQVLENHQNVKKYLKHRYDERDRKMQFTATIEKLTSQTGTPF